MRSLFLASTACLFVLSGQSAFGATSEYVFITEQSRITQTGGIAGVHWTYAIAGRFRLAVDPEAGVASFTQVDANAVDDSPYRRALDPNEVFNMAGLAGTVVSDTSIRFAGKADDGSSVLFALTFEDDRALLTGNTTPPPNSADFFVFSLDAAAQRKYAGGAGEPNDPYQIATAADLIALGETPGDYDKHFILTADIDLDPNLPGRKVFDRAVIAPHVNEANWWFEGTPFTGVFDGNGYTISHLTIIGESYLGLVGQLGSWYPPIGEVRLLSLVDANIIGSGNHAGGLVGCNYGSITMSYSSGSINGEGFVGGLVGRNYASGSVTMSHSAGSVSGTDESVGGLVGSNGGCYFSPHAGVLNCHSTSSVSGKSCVGGLVGQNFENITMSYSHGLVRGGSYVGGLVGMNGAMDVGYGEVTQCYSSGPVSGTGEYVGGLVGNNGSPTRVTSSFWDIQTSGQPTSAGGTGKTTAQMQTSKTFLDTGWDFLGEMDNGTEDIWWILEGRDYPHLWWEKVVGDDFEDGKAGPLWFVFEVDPDLVQIKEVNGRLEVSASNQAQNVDAMYVSQDWRLDTTKDFAMRVDFHFSKQGGGDGRVTLGIGPSLDPEAMQWAELEAGCFDTGPFYLYEVRDGSWVQEQTSDRSGSDGTLYMSYNPDTDELYFSHTGYGKPNAWRTVTGLLKGRWASEPVYVILSGGSEHIALTGADAWLDNFAVQAGAILE